MPHTSKVELDAAIRRDHRDSMKLREKLPPRPTALDPYKAVIDGILRADLDAPRQQRHTVTRIFHRLVEEHGADVSYQQFGATSRTASRRSWWSRARLRWRCSSRRRTSPAWRPRSTSAT
jgi:hypothetical protein